MAFEAFLTQDKAKPKKGRRITYTVSLALHGILLVIGGIYSFWHVEELSPPNVQVTFLSAMSPPPPPPPPPKKRSSSKPKTPQVKPVEVVQPKPTEIVQPREKPKEEPKPEPEEDDSGGDEGEEDGEDNGVVGGVKGGVVGGVVGGTVGGVIGGTGDGEAPKFLAPNIGNGLAIHAPVPQLPPALAKAGMRMNVLVKICVNADGSVKDVTFMKKADPLADEAAMKAMKERKYKPYTVNGRAVPFCHPVNVSFSTY